MSRASAFALAGGMARAVLPLVLLAWLPLAVALQLDGWRMFMSWAEIGADMSLLVLFFSLLAVLWAAACALPALLVPRFRDSAAWSLALLPVVFLIAWNMARAGKKWIESLGAQSLIAGDFRLASAAAIAGMLLFLLWRHGAAGLKSSLEARLAAPFRLSLGIVALSGLFVLVHGARPHIYGHRDRPLGPVARQGLPHIFLLTLDALAAQDMALYGYHLDTTPNLNRFAQTAHVFENFLANANFTTPATTSIESGKYPWTHGVYHLGGFLRGAGQDETLARELADLGYFNLSVTANPWSAPFHHRTAKHYHRDTLPPNPGLLIGHAWEWAFEDMNFHYLLASLSPVEAGRWGESTPYPPRAVYRRAMEMLAEAPRGHPVFLWAHVMPPHEPYLPPPEEKFRYLKDRTLTRHQDFRPPGPYARAEQPLVDRHRFRYDENIRYADREIGAFLDELERKGWLRNAIVIIAADHGESFTRGYLGHAVPSLHQPLVHIPLIVRLPGQGKGSRIPASAEQVDLLPTILDLLGKSPPSWAEGESLKPLLEGGAPSGKPRFSMYLETDSSFAPLKKGSVAVMEGGYKYILDLERGKEELYQLSSDREERDNLASREPVRAARMRAWAEERLRRANGNAARRLDGG